MKDIKKYDALIEPTIQYKREFGFSIGFNFENLVGDNIFSLHALIGGDSLSLNYKMNETPIKQIEKFSLEWYHEFIESLTQFLPIQFAVVRPRNTDFLDRAVTKFKYPVGVVTYFGNEILELTPQIYDTFDCELVEGGVIINLSQVLFESKEGLDSLIENMAKIGKMNSTYLV